MNDTSTVGGLTASFRKITSRRRKQGAFGRWWNGLAKTTRTIILVTLVAYLYVLPTYPPPFVKTPESDWATVLASGMVIYALTALGLNVVVGWCGLLDLGYVGFYAVGAYTAAVLGSQHANLPWLLCLPIAVVVSMLFGLMLGAPTLRLRGDYLAIVTLGFGEIIRITAINSNWLGSTRGIKNIPAPPNIGPIKFNTSDARGIYYLGLSMILVVVFLLHRIESSRVGRAWTAIREDEDAAEMMGVPTFRFKLWAFAIGAGVGGLAGVLNAGVYPGYISPSSFELRLSILFLAAVVLGGTGNMAGAILGGALVSYMPERFRNFSDKRYFVFGVILVIMMVVRPEGLIPRRRAGRTLPAEAIDRPDSPGLAGADLEETITYRGDVAHG